MSKNQSNGRTKLNQVKTNTEAQNSTNKQQVAQGGVLANLKSVKLTPEETEFIAEYRRLEELEREKGIKFF